MNYKVEIRFRDKDGESTEEVVHLGNLSERDAEFKRHINEECAARRYGRTNLISVILESE